MKELTTDDKKIQFLSSIQDRKTKINIIVQSIIDKDKIWEELRKIDDEFSIAYQLIEGTRNVDINYKSIGLPSKMTIGIEIEAEGRISEILPKVIGIWKAKQEDSLQYGIEYVTKEPINDNESSIYEIYRINEVLKTVGMETSERCGGHVHIGADYITEEEGFKELLELWGNAEEVYYLIANKEGELPRENIPYYAPPISRDIQRIEAENIPEDEFLVNAQKIIESRYRGLNIQNINVNNGKNTIEFRVSNGTLDGNTWIENIRLYGRTVEIAEKLGVILKKLENEEELSKEEKELYGLKERLKQEIPLDEKMDILMEILFDEEERKVYRKRYTANKSLDEKEEVVSNMEFKKVDFKKIYKSVEIPEGIIENMQEENRMETEGENSR